MHEKQSNTNDTIRFHITEEEQNALRCFAEKEIKAHGYVSFVDFPLDAIIEHNYGVSRAAIHDEVYDICLMECYDRHGKIITSKGDKTNALAIMAGHCHSLDRCSLKDLLDLEREITGESHRWIPMQAGYSVMVRIDKDTFVADRFIHFDTTEIDDAIERFMDSVEYLPLKSVTTFVMFPNCGHAWNLFLLESYLFRFSGLFRYKVGALNSRNAGVIIRKDSPLVKASHATFNKDYDRILVDAIANSDIDLEENPVLRFLFEEGYIGKRGKPNIRELLIQANSLRERG